MFNSILSNSASKTSQDSTTTWQRAAQAALFTGISLEIAMISKKILFGAAIGGERGLLGLFLATLAVAIGLLALRELNVAEKPSEALKPATRVNKTASLPRVLPVHH